MKTPIAQKQAATLNVYSEVVAAGLILPVRAKYTKRDVDGVIVDSLFRSGATLTENTARFIVRCSAIFHGTEFSRACRSI